MEQHTPAWAISFRRDRKTQTHVTVSRPLFHLCSVVRSSPQGAQNTIRAAVGAERSRARKQSDEARKEAEEKEATMVAEAQSAEGRWNQERCGTREGEHVIPLYKHGYFEWFRRTFKESIR